jgi:hypothetical protein
VIENGVKFEGLSWGSRSVDILVLMPVRECSIAILEFAED